MKKKTFSHLFGLIMLLFSTIAVAQVSNVSGVVSDENGPLPGVNIVEKGTTNGVISDFDGNYTISDLNTVFSK